MSDQNEEEPINERYLQDNVPHEGVFSQSQNKINVNYNMEYEDGEIVDEHKNNTQRSNRTPRSHRTSMKSTPTKRIAFSNGQPIFINPQPVYVDHRQDENMVATGNPHEVEYVSQGQQLKSNMHSQQQYHQAVDQIYKRTTPRKSHNASPTVPYPDSPQMQQYQVRQPDTTQFNVGPSNARNSPSNGQMYAQNQMDRVSPNQEMSESFKTARDEQEDQAQEQDFVLYEDIPMSPIKYSPQKSPAKSGRKEKSVKSQGGQKTPKSRKGRSGKKSAVLQSEEEEVEEISDKVDPRDIQYAQTLSKQKKIGKLSAPAKILQAHMSTNYDDVVSKPSTRKTRQTKKESVKASRKQQSRASRSKKSKKDVVEEYEEEPIEDDSQIQMPLIAEDSVEEKTIAFNKQQSQVTEKQFADHIAQQNNDNHDEIIEDDNNDSENEQMPQVDEEDQYVEEQGFNQDNVFDPEQEDIEDEEIQQPPMEKYKTGIPGDQLESDDSHTVEEGDQGEMNEVQQPYQPLQYPVNWQQSQEYQNEEIDDEKQSYIEEPSDSDEMISVPQQTQFQDSEENEVVASQVMGQNLREFGPDDNAQGYEQIDEDTEQEQEDNISQDQSQNQVQQTYTEQDDEEEVMLAQEQLAEDEQQHVSEDIVSQENDEDQDDEDEKDAPIYQNDIIGLQNDEAGWQGQYQDEEEEAEQDFGQYQQEEEDGENEQEIMVPSSRDRNNLIYENDVQQHMDDEAVEEEGEMEAYEEQGEEELDVDQESIKLEQSNQEQIDEQQKVELEDSPINYYDDDEEEEGEYYPNSSSDTANAHNIQDGESEEFQIQEQANEQSGEEGQADSNDQELEAFTTKISASKRDKASSKKQQRSTAKKDQSHAFSTPMKVTSAQKKNSKTSYHTSYAKRAPPMPQYDDSEDEEMEEEIVPEVKQSQAKQKKSQTAKSKKQQIEPEQIHKEDGKEFQEDITKSAAKLSKDKARRLQQLEDSINYLQSILDQEQEEDDKHRRAKQPKDFMDQMIDPFPDFSNVVPSAEKKPKQKQPKSRQKKGEQLDVVEEPSTMNQFGNFDSIEMGSLQTHLKMQPVKQQRKAQKSSKKDTLMSPIQKQNQLSLGFDDEQFTTPVNQQKKRGKPTKHDDEIRQSEEDVENDEDQVIGFAAQENHTVMSTQTHKGHFSTAKKGGKKNMASMEPDTMGLGFQSPPFNNAFDTKAKKGGKAVRTLIATPSKFVDRNHVEKKLSSKGIKKTNLLNIMKLKARKIREKKREKKLKDEFQKKQLRQKLREKKLRMQQKMAMEKRKLKLQKRALVEKQKESIRMAKERKQQKEVEKRVKNDAQAKIKAKVEREIEFRNKKHAEARKIKSDVSSPTNPKMAPQKPGNTPRKERPQSMKAQTPTKKVVPPSKKQSPEPVKKSSKSQSAGKKQELESAPIRQLRGNRGIIPGKISLKSTSKTSSKVSPVAPKNDLKKVRQDKAEVKEYKRQMAPVTKVMKKEIPLPMSKKSPPKTRSLQVQKLNLGLVGYKRPHPDTKSSVKSGGQTKGKESSSHKQTFKQPQPMSTRKSQRK